MEAPINTGLIIDTPIQEPTPPNIAPIIPEEERSAASLETGEGVDDLEEERSETNVDDRDRTNDHSMSLRSHLPPTNAHRNTYEKDFQHLQKAELCGTFPNITVRRITLACIGL